jgi:hypothetical protein
MVSFIDKLSPPHTIHNHFTLIILYVRECEMFQIRTDDGLHRCNENGLLKQT